jgi:hypothetical protein
MGAITSFEQQQSSTECKVGLHLHTGEKLEITLDIPCVGQKYDDVTKFDRDFVAEFGDTVVDYTAFTSAAGVIMVRSRGGAFLPVAYEVSSDDSRVGFIRDFVHMVQEEAITV